MSIGESELVFTSNVDDWFYARVTAAIEQEDGDFNTSLEEAFIDTLSLPGNTTLRFGRFYSGVGYLNEKHAHNWEFSDQALPYSAFLGIQYGDDGLQFRWLAPNGNIRDRNFIFQTEYLWRNEDGRYELPGLENTGSVKNDATGWYAQAIYQWQPRWRAGLRIDGLALDDPGKQFAGTELDTLGSDPIRYSLMMDYSNSEFSRIRLQFNRDESGPQDDNQVILQYIMSIGAHGAHEFQGNSMKLKYVLGLGLVVTLQMAGSARASVDVFACEPEWAALAEELGGNNVETSSATNALQDPHYIQARPGLIAVARKAELLICSGSGLKAGWLPLLLRKANNPKILPGKVGSLMASEFVNRLEIPVVLDRSQGDLHAQGNPHIQTDPRNLIPVARVIAQRLQQIDPGNALIYQKNLAAFEEKWSAAIAIWQTRAEPLRGKPVVLHHRSWVYLDNWLGLVEVATLETGRPKFPTLPCPLLWGVRRERSTCTACLK